MDPEPELGCTHQTVSCLNPYELIRKYRCHGCGSVMMCACEEVIGRRFLPHQLLHGTELETQRRVPVTGGFQVSVCKTCRGMPEDPHPMAQTYGRTSKLVRYYWREIWFETTRRFADWCEREGHRNREEAQRTHKNVYKTIERQVTDEVRDRHQRDPKYRFLEQSQSEVLTNNRVEVVKLDGVYVRQHGQEKKAALLHEGTTHSVEQFVALHFERLGFQVIHTESIPFHALFGVYFWLLVQDPDDPRGRLVGFGERGAYEDRRPGRTIWMELPEDFGAPGYARRRAAAIDEHFQTLLRGGRKELLWTFDYWVGPSESLRQYLWAHHPADVARAREIASVLPPDVVRQILRYLVGAYWQRFCGWPDLLAYKDGEFVFLEVKSSGDELSEDQKRWIKDNSDELHLPFKVVKIHKKRVVELPGPVAPEPA